MSAATELDAFLRDGEVVEAIVFGPWGWGNASSNGQAWEFGYGEPGEDTNDPPVPFAKRGVVLAYDEARPMMQTWEFEGGHGAPDCYAVRIWTNQRIIWVTQYDGATGLDSAERNPGPCMPDMPGG